MQSQMQRGASFLPSNDIEPEYLKRQDSRRRVAIVNEIDRRISLRGWGNENIDARPMINLKRDQAEKSRILCIIFFEKFEFLADDSPDDLIYRRREISRDFSKFRKRGFFWSVQKFLNFNFTEILILIVEKFRSSQKVHSVKTKYLFTFFKKKIFFKNSRFSRFPKKQKKKKNKIEGNKKFSQKMFVKGAKGSRCQRSPSYRQFPGSMLAVIEVEWR